MRKYYDDHASDYMLPAFIKLSTIGFSSLSAAEAAVKQIRGGTNIEWLRANAAERVSHEQQADELIRFIETFGVPEERAH